MPTYEVFGRRKWEDNLEHAGTVHAPDHETALLLVRETHFRHNEGVEYAVVKSDHLHVMRDPSMLEHAIDMSYRLQSGYSGFREKREKAREAARRRGRGHLQERAVPGKGGGSRGAKQEAG